MNYSRALALLKGKHRRNIPSVRSTSIEIDQGTGDIELRYHGTAVVTWRKDGAQVLNSGGWRTVTTKARINEYSDYQVWQEKGIWYVGSYRADPRIVFADGMRFAPDSSQPIYDGETPEDPREIQKLRKRVNKYAQDFARNLAEGAIAKPSSGDCWYCSMVTVDKGESIGDAFKDRDHLMSHLDEAYYVPSILAHILKADNNGLSIAAKDWLACKLGMAEADAATKQSIDRAYRSIAFPQVRAAIANYFFHRLGMTNTTTRYSH